ncbi:MAG: hypothetical protein J2P45_01150 [Candidatus Dormibacteraeota bacterium]|nr:hypothetical protein [Candidatus Dormibacteraeota bacterium]
MRKFIVATALAVGVFGFSLMAASAASGGGATVKAVTHASGHPDTTSVSGPCTATSPNGPVWAYDNLSRQLTATLRPDQNWDVTITDHGSFAAIADPNTGDCSFTGSGSVDGYLHYVVASTGTPSAANLPAQMDGNIGSFATIQQFFGKDNLTSVVGGGEYSYSYNPVDGGVYTQSSS